MTLDNRTLDRLAETMTIDLTTTGRRSGRPSRVEIWWFRFEDRFLITGTPGPRDWYANVLADPAITVHALGDDLSATARPIEDRPFRRRFFESRSASWYGSQAELERLVEHSPMIEVLFAPA